MKSKMIFLGPPGAGKGTHGEIVADEFGIKKISTGDILRSEIKEETEVGNKAKDYMDKGELVPDEIVIEMLKKAIQGKEGFILDGFPRTVEQARALEDITDVDLVVNFQLSKETVLQRLGGRLTCKQCGEIYHITNNPPKEDGKCDKCGGELYQREDQKDEIIEQRLEEYKKKTQPLIDYYRDKGNLIDVSVEGSIDEVAHRILKAIKNALGE